MIIFGYQIFGSPLFGQIVLSVFIAYLLAKALTGRRRSERTEESRELVRMPVREFMPERKPPIRITENPYYPARQETRFAGSESGSIAGSVLVAIIVGIVSSFLYDWLKGGF